MRVTPEERELWHQASDFRGFRYKGSSNMSDWLRDMANSDAREVQDLLREQAPPEPTRPFVTTRERIHIRKGKRLSPPCDHVDKGTYCERCGRTR